MSNNRTLTITWEDPLAGAAKGLKMAGLEYMHAIVNGEIPPPPIGQLLNMSFEDVGKGWIEFSFLPHESQFNPIGTVHGGPIATILDSATGCAVHTMLPAGVGYTTLEIKVNYVRPVTLKTDKLFCKGSVIHNGRRTATSEAHLRDADGKLYAHATSTCMIFPLP